MTQPEIAFTTRLAHLTNELLEVNTKVELLYHLDERKNDRLEEMNIAPAFFGITIDCLQAEVIISLFRIYDRDQKSASLYSFISFVEANLDIFSKDAFLARNPDRSRYWHPERQITSESIQNHRRELSLQHPILENLRLRRNKRYAHMDQDYAYEPLRLNDEAPLSFADARKLVKLGTSIIDSYSAAFDNSFQSWHVLNRFDIDSVLDILHQHRSDFREE